MHRPNEPSLSEDLGHLSLIALAALVAVAGTAVLTVALAPPPQPRVEYTFGPVTATPVAEPAPEVDPAAGAERLFGRVHTTAGEEITGYLRWDGSESAWADVLPARALGTSALAGLRFGHVATLEPLDALAVLATLKTGELVELAAIPADGSAALQPLEVETVGGPATNVAWLDVERVELFPDPVEAAPKEERLHGTLLTRDGTSLTGYLAWNRSVSLLGSGVPGSGAGEPTGLTFADLVAVERDIDGRARLTRASGGVVATDLVAGPAAEPEITVSDPGLGAVVVPWSRMRQLRFHRATAPAAFDAYTGSAPLLGTLVTETGEEIRGAIRWDDDETSGHQLLDGLHMGTEYHVELRHIAKIAKYHLGAHVTLRDGRSLYLIGSNDVNWTNKGIEVRAADSVRRVSWDEFAEVRFR